MTSKKYTSFISLIVLSCMGCMGSCLSIVSVVSAADGQVTNLWDNSDNAVSSLLLAAGMYGFAEGQVPEISLSASKTQNQFMGLSTVPGQLDEQSITLSYNGSSGKLGFSAGYIYTSLDEHQDSNAVLLGFDADQQNPFTKSNPWYMSLDLSKSFQVNDNIALGISSKAMLMKTPFEEQEGRIVSMLLNLPLSYKEYFTITPELQWFRTLPDTATESYGNNYSGNVPTEEQDVVYGGMSISFSY